MTKRASEGRKKGLSERFYYTRGKVSLRALFSGLVILTFVMTLTLTLFASYRSEQKLLEERTLSANFRESDRVAQAINLLFISIKNNLNAFSGEFVETTSLDASNKNVDRLKLLYDSGGYYAAVFAAQADGEISIMYQGSGEKTEREKVEAAALENALEARASFQSLPYTDPHGGVAVLLSEPVYTESGEYLGIVGGVLHLQTLNVLSNLFHENALEHTGSYSYVVDMNGKIVYHPDKERIGEDVGCNSAVAHLINGESGQEKILNSKDITFLAGYVTVSAAGWGVITQTPTSLISEQQMEQVRGTLLVVLVPFLILAASALFLARRLTAPFVYLANFVAGAADRPGEAMPSIRRHWNREADLLNQAVLRTVREMKQQHQDLNDVAFKDPLTGLLNRRALDEALDKLEREGSTFSLLLIDIDYFKSVNDTYGHAAGDEVLRMVAHTLEKTIDSMDFCGRYGGEEFVVLLPDRSIPETYEMAERLRMAVANHKNSLQIPITLSIGASICPLQAKRLGDLFDLADRALYRAKEGGRNRVVI
ncbi:sensor domain-containing diguanylate cyclase [Saccharibacillus kuerlensis]|uniref:sensor domain-containing diguanylate cyclase n=1 Tax=Saccharibacillus kuerlensis TaxID=459527 RepID=UPI000684859B|nr:diguanylate cyclase [Saccharibacillus kuerlensis]